MIELNWAPFQQIEIPPKGAVSKGSFIAHLRGLRCTAAASTRQRPGEIDLAPAIPNLINAKWQMPSPSGLLSTTR